MALFDKGHGKLTQKKNIIIIIIYPVLTQASESPWLTPTPPGCSIISPLPFCQLLRFGPVFDGGGGLSCPMRLGRWLALPVAALVHSSGSAVLHGNWRDSV